MVEILEQVDAGRYADEDQHERVPGGPEDMRPDPTPSTRGPAAPIVDGSGDLLAHGCLLS
jgi:hypothetical protein